MKGEVLHYDDNSGQGQISGADGIRYSFSRADLKQLVPISKGCSDTRETARNTC